MRLLSSVLILIAGLSAGSCSKSMQTPVTPASTEDKAFVTIPKGDAYYGTTNFSPVALTVTVGGTVTWINNDGEVHKPTQDDNAWTNELGTGSQYTRTYTTAGTFPYHCELHKEMKGTITVK